MKLFHLRLLILKLLMI